MEEQQDVNTFTTFFLPGNIRQLRKTINLSQEDLARRVGLNRGNIASYENGTAEPRICSLLKIANTFNVSIIDLVLKDLTDLANYESAMTTFKQQSQTDKYKIEHQLKNTEEIKTVIESLHNCHVFKLKSMDENTPRELKAMAHKFEELYEVTDQLLKNQIELLEFVQCRLENNSNAC